MRKSNSECCSFLKIRLHARFRGTPVLRGADGGEDAHKAEVGKEPREDDGEAQEGAEFGKKLQVAGEKRQRRLRDITHAHSESVSWRRALAFAANH